MANEPDDTAEEILVYAEFEDDVDLRQYKNINILDIISANPVVQMDDTFFTGEYNNPLGTYMFFQDVPAPPTEDPLFDKVPEKNLGYLCKSRKFIKMEHAQVTPKETKNQNEDRDETSLNSDIDIASFKTVDEAINKFKNYWDKLEQNGPKQQNP